MKKLVPSMMLGLSLYMTSVALADPVALNGDIAVKYEKDKADSGDNLSGTMSTFTLRAETSLGNNWSMYARLGAQYATQPQLADFNTEAYPDNKKTVVALDQFGVTYKSDHFTYNLGRQEAAVGTTALLYSRSGSNIGKHHFVDGITADGKIGIMKVSALLAQEDNIGAQDNRLYAVHTSYQPAENLQWGVTLGQYRDSNNGNTNHWAVDGTYQFGKSSLTAEYTKSNSQADNKAYAAQFNYAFDDKTAVYITNFKVEANGAMGQQSDFDNENQGFYYGITHQLSDADALEIVYKDQKTVTGGDKNTKLEATIHHSF